MEIPAKALVKRKGPLSVRYLSRDKVCFALISPGLCALQKAGRHAQGSGALPTFSCSCRVDLRPTVIGRRLAMDAPNRNRGLAPMSMETLGRFKKIKKSFQREAASSASSLRSAPNCIL